MWSVRGSEILIQGIAAVALFASVELYARLHLAASWFPFSFVGTEMELRWSPHVLAGLTLLSFALLVGVLLHSRRGDRVMTILIAAVAGTFMWRLANMIYLVVRRPVPLDAEAAAAGLMLEGLLVVTIMGLWFWRNSARQRTVRVAFAWLTAFQLLNVAGGAVPITGVM